MQDAGSIAATQVVVASMWRRLLFLFLFTIVCTVMVSADQLTNKVAKKFGNSMRTPSFFAQSKSSESSRAIQSESRASTSESEAKVMKKTDVSVSVFSGPFVKHVAMEFVDEVVDIYDSIMFAEDGAERLDNMIDIAHRHRYLIGGVIAFPVLKNALSKEVMQKKGLDFISKERAAQAAKWGAR